MIQRLSLLALFFALSTGMPRAAQGQEAAASGDEWDARLMDFRGEVQIYAAGEDKPLPPEKGMPLSDGDRVVTGNDSSVELSLDGGSLIRLSAHSDFTLMSGKRNQTQLRLAFGTLLAKIGRLLASQSLAVQTPTALAAVRGTEFGVEIDRDNPEESHVGVFDEGRLEVRGQSGLPETLIGGQETKVARGQPPLRPYQLERLSKHRSFMRTAMRQRLQNLRKGWRALSPSARHALREKTISRLREHREEIFKKIRENREQLKGDRSRVKDRREGEYRKKKEKMEQVREQFRKREERDRSDRRDRPPPAPPERREPGP